MLIILLKYFLYFVAGTTFLIAGLISYLIWFQPPFYFPKPTGKYPVGVRAYHWIDTQRKETLHDDPAHPYREIMVTIWYPARGIAPVKPANLYAPYWVMYYKKNQPLAWLALGLSRSIYSYAQSNAPLATDVPQFPVIIFSPGFGSIREGNTAHCEELASQGYIVVGISHPYDSLVVQFPDGHRADGAQSIAKRDKTRRIFDDAQYNPVFTEPRIADVHFVLDQLDKLARDKESMFYNRFDQKNIGIVGHSLGGGTAVQICRHDPRVKACVALDGFLFGNDAVKPVAKPCMFMLAGEYVTLFERPWTQNEWNRFGIVSQDDEKKNKSRYLPAIEQLAQSNGAPVYTFVLKNAGHMAFSDCALLKHAAILSCFFDNFAAGSLNGFRATEIVNAYLVNFFNKYLKGQQSAVLDDKETPYRKIEQIKST